MEEEHSKHSHFSLGSVFKHVAVMAAIMAVPGAVAAMPLGVEPNLLNAAAIGLDSTVDMMVSGPLSALPDFIENFSLGGDLTYEFGSVSHHGMEHGLENGLDHAMEQGAAQSGAHALHSAPADPEMGQAMTSWLGDLQAGGSLDAVMEDCGDNLVSCFQEQYYHPPGH